MPKKCNKMVCMIHSQQMSPNPQILLVFHVYMPYSTAQYSTVRYKALRYTLRCLNHNQAEEDAPVDAMGVTVTVSMVITC
jgi:hypothetical protein